MLRNIPWYVYTTCLQCRRPQFNSWVRKICWRRDRLPTPVFLGFPFGSGGKESACNAGDLGLIPGLGRSPGEGKGYPFQYSGLENSMDCIVQGVTKSWTQLSDFHFTSQLVWPHSLYPRSPCTQLHAAVPLFVPTGSAHQWWASLTILGLPFFIKKKKIIWLHWVLVSAHRIFFFFNCGMWNLVAWPGIEPGVPALRAQSLSHWMTREVPLSTVNGPWWSISFPWWFFFVSRVT